MDRCINMEFSVLVLEGAEKQTSIGGMDMSDVRFSII